MKHSEYVKILVFFLCSIIVMTLSSCQSTEYQSNPPETQPMVSEDNFEEKDKMDSGDSEPVEVNVLDLPDLREVQESQNLQEPQEDFLALYIGKTVGDVVRDLGDEYMVEYYEGSTMIGYPGNLWFLFGSVEDAITDDLIIRQMIASGHNPVVYELTGAMTYPEIVEVVGEEAKISQPDYSYSEADEDWRYTLGFTYREYNLSYTWLDNPENTPSASVYVLRQDMESLSPTVPQLDDNPPENKDDLFCGPGWFDGVMGCRFYVSDGFAQQDLVPAMGYYYSFRNSDLNMSISVEEMTFMMLGIDSTEMANEYTSRAADSSVTYTTSGDDFYVISGYYDTEGDATIYYNRVDYDEEFRYEVSFQYPASKAEEGGQILLEFLKNYSTS